MSSLIIGIIVVVAVVAIVLVVVGSRRPEEKEDSLGERLANFAEMDGNISSLEEIELQLPISERIFLPMAQKLGDIAVRFTPQHARRDIEIKLELAGSPAGLDASTFWAIRIVAAIGLGVLAFMGLFRGSSIFSGTMRFGFLFGAPLIGYFFPQMWLSSKINRRQDEIRKAMPDALDLLTICVEAGLGFDAAMKKVNEKWENELSLAFGRVIQEIQLGKLRREALRDMAERIGIPEITSFVAAIIQSEQLGVSMSKVLRIQSEQMRMKRRQHAEEEAHKAPIKMLMPMAGCIFPSILVILLGPAMLLMMNSALKGVLF